MLVKELPEGTNLTLVKVKLPEAALESFKGYAGGEPEMWVAGPMMGDFFLTSNARGDEKKRLYPFPVNLEPSDILEWEVVENLN